MPGAFGELGRVVEEAWRRADHDELAFPDIATEHLGAARLNERISPSDVIEWTAWTDVLPPQGLSDKFGEPPVVVYQGHRFYIEVLFWLDGTTSIHEHGFSGAFGVLAGSSLESSYSFTLQKRVNSRFRIGELKLQDVEMLRAGDVRPIVAGEAGAHALFHLDRPSVSVVVRTIADPESQPQFTYRRPWVSFDPFHVDPQINRRVRALGVFLATGDDAYFDVARGIIERNDLEMCYNVLEQAALDEFGRTRYAELAEAARTKHGEVADLFEEVFQERRREAHIVGLRARYRDADHRFFLALLLNLSRRDLIERMISLRYPGQDPWLLLQRWLRDLTGESSIGLEVDDMTLAMLKHMQSGLDLGAILDRLSVDAEQGAFPVSISRIANQYAMLNASSVLRPLLAP